jgi:hypothetical protein
MKGSQRNAAAGSGLNGENSEAAAQSFNSAALQSAESSCRKGGKA